MEYETDLTYTFPSEDGREEKDPDLPQPEPYTDDEWGDYPTHFERVQDAGYAAGDPESYHVL